MKPVAKLVLSLSSVLSLLSCVSTYPVLSGKNQIAIENNRDEVITALANQAKSCWTKSYSFFGGDALNVEHASYGITVSRWAPDLDYMATQPFFRLRVMKDGENSVVYTSEVECGNRCLTADVQRWLSGDLRCELPK